MGNELNGEGELNVRVTCACERGLWCTVHFHIDLQVSPECLTPVLWFPKVPKAEESPWDPASPGPVLV